MSFAVKTVTAAWVLGGLLSTGCDTALPRERDAVPFATADAQLETYDLAALDATVLTLNEGPDRDYFRGMYAARSGRFDVAIEQLTRALPALRENAPTRAAVALEALGTSYFATNRYGDAATAYDDLNRHFRNAIAKFPDDDAAMVRILKDTPPQSIEWDGPVHLTTAENPIGSRATELSVNGVSLSWLMDTGANQSVITRSAAVRLGLTLLPGVVPVGSGVTGLKSTAQVAVIPDLPLGSATLRHVVVLVFDDKDLKIDAGPFSFQIDAVLGYPVFKALGAFTFTHDHQFRAGTMEAQRAGARLFMRGLTPAVEGTIEDRPLLFTFDTGASSSDLSVRYYELFRTQAAQWKKKTFQVGGAGGSVQRELYVQPCVTVTIGPTPVTLEDVGVTPERTGGGLDQLFGNLGQDLVDDVESFSVDFEHMLFALGPARARPPRPPR